MLIGNLRLSLSCCFWVVLSFFFPVLSNFSFFLVLSDLPSVLHTIFFSQVEDKARIPFKIVFQSSLCFYFSHVYTKANLHAAKQELTESLWFPFFLSKQQSAPGCAVLSLADSRMAMGCTVRGWRQSQKSASNSDLFDSDARGRNGWKWKFSCFQQAILCSFLGLEENWATYKRSSKFPLCNSSFSAMRAKGNLSGADKKGRCWVIASKK